MKEIASGRIGTAAARYGEHAPMATVCCNACRTCVTANLVGAAMVGLSGLAASASGLLRRRTRRHRERAASSPDEPARGQTSGGGASSV